MQVAHQVAWIAVAVCVAWAWLGTRAFAQDRMPHTQPQSVQATPTARAAPRSGPALNWTREPGAEACIASVELAQRVEQRLGRRLFVPAPDAIVAIEGYVAPAAGGGFRAELTVSDGHGVRYGTRELSTARVTPDCRSLDDALTLVIAVTLRPEGGQIGGVELPEDVALELDALFGQEPTEPDPADFAPAPAGEANAASSRTEPAATQPSGQTVRRPENRSDDAVHLALRAHGFLQSGLQSGPGYGPAAALSATLPWLGELAVGGGFSVRTTERVDDADVGAELGTRVVFATFAWCPHAFDLSLASLALCANALGGSVDVNASGFATSNVGGAGALFATGLGGRLDVPFAGPLALSLAAGPTVRLLRPSFRYTSQSGRAIPLGGQDRFGVSAQLGLSLRLF